MLNRIGFDAAWLMACLRAVELVCGAEEGAAFAIDCGALAIIAQLPEERLSGALWLLVKLGIVDASLRKARLERWGAPGLGGVVIRDGGTDRFVVLGDRAGVVCDSTLTAAGRGLSLPARLAQIADLDPAWMLTPPIDRARRALEVTP